MTRFGNRSWNCSYTVALNTAAVDISAARHATS
jgi:hypothetical protein